MNVHIQFKKSKKRFTSTIALTLALTLVLAPTFTFAATSSLSSTTGSFGSDARIYLTDFSNEIGARIAGTATEKKGADFISAKFKALGYKVENQPFTYTSEYKGKKTTGKSQNIMVVKPGLSKKEIIIGAHYDSVNVGHGADDNGSAIAVMLETAKRMKDVKSNYTLRFIAFGAEEVDLCGSTYYASKMSKTAISNTLLMVNMDSLIAGDNMYVYGGYGEDGRVRDWVMKTARIAQLNVTTNMGENPEFPLGTTGDFSDHAPFKNIGIDYIYFEGTNWLLGEQDGYTQVDLKKGEKGEIWHTQYDTLEYLDKTFPGRVDEHLNAFSVLLYNVLTQYKF